MTVNKNFLFVTTDLNIGFFVVRTKNEGNNIKVFANNCDKWFLDGFIEDNQRVTNWKKYISWADIIVFDDVGWGKYSDKLRKEGKLVVGCSEYTDKLEMDREFGQNELKKMNINTLKEMQFDSVEKVISYIKSKPGRYVLKPCGIHDMDGTIVGEEEDGLDLVEILKNDTRLHSKKSSFFLQEYVNGIEVEVGAAFKGDDFVYPIDVSFEHKRFFTGDLGPMTWEMGTLMYFSDMNYLFRETLLKFKDKLKQAGYIGEIGLNCIVNERGIFPLEFTCRFGFPATQIIWEGETQKVSDYLWNLATGRIMDRKLSDTYYNVGVCICLPPFPYNDPKEMRKYDGALIRIKDQKQKGIFFVYVSKKNGNYFANSYCPLVVVAREKTVAKAREEVYRRIKNVSIENMYYRTDIAEKWDVDSKLLRRWGYIN